MHPAFSVIFFTVLSGAGYGIWFWIGLRCMSGPHPRDFGAWAWLPAWALGAVLIIIGLLSSVGHLGKPLRSWRAFSQWRTSWLSREGVLSLATFVPAIGTAWLLIADAPEPESMRLRVVAGLLCAMCLLTVYCTAKIYQSLVTIPEWNDKRITPVYLLASLVSGGAIVAAMIAWQQQPSQLHMMIFFVPVMLALILVKASYWKHIDKADSRPSLGAAVGLQDRDVTVFEKPNTQANYLNKEMGYVMARKHVKPLRSMFWLLSVIVPIVCWIGVWLLARNGLLYSVWPGIVHSIAAISCLIGLLVERWLFFAQARHIVDRYYNG